MIPPMELLIAALILAAIQLVGFGGMIWVHKRMLDRQWETVRMLAIFKKATDTHDVAHMVEITEDRDVREAREAAVKIPIHESFLPDELPAEALSNIRLQMGHEPIKQ